MFQYLSRHRKNLILIILCLSIFANFLKIDIGYAKEPFPDMPAWGGESINYLVMNGSIQGYPDGTFRPKEELTRAQAATILALTLKLTVQDDEDSTFKDVKNHWAEKYIAAIIREKKNVIHGYPDGTFKPNRTITRAELSKMIVEAYQLKENVNVNVTFKDMPEIYAPYIKTLGSLGIVVGPVQNEFRPSENVTRLQMAAIIHRTEDKSQRLPVPEKKSYPAISDVKVFNETKFEVTFEQAVNENLAKEIEYSGKRFAVYIEGQSVHSQNTVQSQMISFDKTYKKATVILSEDTIIPDAKYTISFMDGDYLKVAGMITSFTPIVLKRGTKQPTVIIDDQQEKVIVQFHEKMDIVALEAKNYSIYRNNQLQGSLNEYMRFGEEKTSAKGEWVDATEKTAVEFSLSKHPSQKKFAAGGTFKVLVSNHVETEKGTILSDVERVAPIQMPSLQEAQPKAKIARVVDGSVIITFDKYLSQVFLNPILITIKKLNGHSIPVKQVLTSITDGTLSEKEIKLIVDADASLENTLSYTIDLPENLVANAMFPNALNTKEIGLQANAQKDIEILKVSAEMIQQTSDKGKANLKLKFDQRVDLEHLKGAFNGIKIKDGTLVYSLIENANLILDDDDMTGKTILIQDVEKDFVLNTVNDEKGFKSQSGKNYQLEIAQSTIKTENGEKLNQEKLLATFSGISISAPELEKIMLTSAHEITIVFKEEIEAKHLQTHHVKVLGYERYKNGVFTQTPILLTGDSQIKIQVNEKEVKITTANDQIIFVTDGRLDLLQVHGDVIKGKESGVVNPLLTSENLNMLSIIDRARPVMIGMRKIDDNKFSVFYSEPIHFKEHSSAIQASQFSVENAKKNAYGIEARLAEPNENGLSIKLDLVLNKQGVFQSDLNMEKVKVIYEKNKHVFVKDYKSNQQENQQLIGMWGVSIQ